MKTITLHQPWATLVVIGAKTIETRSWSTDWRGPLAIHASKSFPWMYRELVNLPHFAEALRRAGYPSWEHLPLGVVLGQCRIKDCVRIPNIGVRAAFFRRHAHDANERRFGDYTPGRFAWPLKDHYAYPDPYPARGFQRIWDWDWFAAAYPQREREGTHG
jgi:activating signal cointegrator 1